MAAAGCRHAAVQANAAEGRPSMPNRPPVALPDQATLSAVVAVVGCQHTVDPLGVDTMLDKRPVFDRRDSPNSPAAAIGRRSVPVVVADTV